jgi:hypothetical protein
MEAVVLIGIQASGKTTFYQQRFVVDNTNITAAERARYILPSRAAGFRVIGYSFAPAGFFGTLKGDSQALRRIRPALPRLDCAAGRVQPRGLGAGVACNRHRPSVALRMR